METLIAATALSKALVRKVFYKHRISTSAVGEKLQFQKKVFINNQENTVGIEKLIGFHKNLRKYCGIGETDKTLPVFALDV